MKLYHGSNVYVQEPRIIDSGRKLDFGTGFYVTSSYEQAERWAVLTARRRKEGFPCITSYEFDEKELNTLQVLRFSEPSEDWLDFVCANRNGITENIQYDIISGPVANDRTMPVLSLYFSGIYDKPETIRRLLPQKLNDQFAFKTDTAIQKLVFSEELKP